MAFVDPNEQAPGPAVQTQTQQAPIAAGGAGVGGSTKAPATPGQNVPAQPSAQLSAYLAANQPQSTQFAGNVAGTVGSQVNAAGAAINPAVNTYTGQLYTVPTNADANKAVESSPSSLTPDQAAAFKAEVGAAAAAPGSSGTFETTQPYQDAASGIQKAVEQANLWGAGNDVSSISTALTPFEGANATIGDRTLDSLLLSQTPEAYKQISAAAAPAKALPGQLAAGTTAADAALQAAIAQDTAATGAANASGQKFATGLNSTLAGYLAQAQKDADAYNASLNGLSTNVSAVQPQIAALKDAVAAYNAMQAMNPATGQLPKIQYGEPSAMPSTVSAPDIGTLASKQQYSDVAALLDLLGPNAPSTSINPANAAMAGTYSSPTNNIPGVNTILSSFSNPVGPGLMQADQVFQSHLQNPALWNERSVYDALQKAYTDMQNAEMGIFAPNPNQTPTAPTPTPPTGGPGEGPSNPPPGVSPTPPPGAEPGSAAYDAWLTAMYPGLNIPGYDPVTGVLTPLPPGRYGVL